MGTPENLDIDLGLDLDDQADGELTLMEAASWGTRIMLGTSGWDGSRGLRNQQANC